MPIRPILRLAFMLALSASAAVAPAQNQTPSPVTPTAVTASVLPVPSGDDSATYTIRASANEVNLIFTVRDRHGRFINNLKQSDFALLDNQQAPAQVFSFSQQTNLSLRVGILMDASTSVRGRIQFEQQATTEFLRQLLRAGTDKAFIMGFDSTPDLKQDWTSNLDRLKSGIDAVGAGGGTAMYDALYSACHDKLLDETPGREPVRNVVVLVSDGNDNQSRVLLEDSIKMCQRTETIVYAISTNTGPMLGRGDEVLRRIAVATGGTPFFPHKFANISDGFRKIANELRSQYALQYRPADFKADGSFRRIYVSCLDSRYTVRAKEGYFTPKDPQQ